MRADNVLPGAAPGVTTTTVHIKETIRVDQYPPAEETDFYYTKERLSYIGLIKTLGIVAIAVSIASLVLASIHVSIYPLPFTSWLIAAACLFLIGAALSVYWSFQATKSFKASHDLFQPQLKEGLSHGIFIFSILLAGAAAASLVHLFMEYEYSPDYAQAQTTTDQTWDDRFPGRTYNGLASFFKKHFIVQTALVGFLFFYFLLTARAAFSCLKFGNQAMSYLVFLGNLLLLVFSLVLIYFADYAFDYEDYPQLRAHFPVWNIRGLYFVGIALVAAAVIGFLIDHRSWRVGFFVLAFLLLILLVILTTFTGFAYRHTRQTYQYYQDETAGTCQERMDLVHMDDLEGYGCPMKYTPTTSCPTNNQVFKWEGTQYDNSGVTTSTTTTTTTTTTTAATPDQAAAAHSDALKQAADQQGQIADQQNQAAAQQPAEQPAQQPAPSFSSANSIDDDFQFAQASQPYSCLNVNCCGQLGQLYTNHLLLLSVFGLLAAISATYVSIGCYYFWYVTWVDTARDKRRDFAWLGLMGLAVLAFIIVFFTVDRYYIHEKLGSDQRHLEMLTTGW